MKEKHFDILAIYSTNTTLLIVPKTIVAKGTTVQVEKTHVRLSVDRQSLISHFSLHKSTKKSES